MSHPLGTIPLLHTTPPLLYLSDPLLLSEGRSLEKVPSHLLAPGILGDWTGKRWTNGTLRKGPSKTEYTYTWETGDEHNGNKPTRTVLRAKKVGGRFYVSQYRSFPQSCGMFLDNNEEGESLREGRENRGEERPPSHYFAVLVQGSSEDHFRLLLTSRSPSYGALDSGVKELARISHGTKHIKETGAAVRVLKVACPKVCEVAKPTKPTKGDDEGDGEGDTGAVLTVPGGGSAADCWACYSGGGGEEEEAERWEHTVAAVGGVQPGDGRRERSRKQEGIEKASSLLPLAGLGKGGRVLFANKPPQWSASAGSLVLQFDRSRVHRPSAKNFVLFLSSTLPSNPPSSEAVVQFGKTMRGTYSLDFRAPMCPVQALGIALSTFAWNKE